MADTSIPDGTGGAPEQAVPFEHEIRLFNNFTANLTTRQLFNDCGIFQVEPKVFQMLALLVRHPGAVISYQEFKNAIWPNVVIELPENVNALASKLRETLGESRNGTRYIMNKRGEGYYFNLDVSVKCLRLPPAGHKATVVAPVPMPAMVGPPHLTESETEKAEPVSEPTDSGGGSLDSSTKSLAAPENPGPSLQDSTNATRVRPGSAGPSGIGVLLTCSEFLHQS